MIKAGLNIIADANIWGAKSAFSQLGQYKICLNILKHQDITPANIRDADILLTRSSTHVNQDLLEASKVKFVGTATIGDDHVDKNYLAAQSIRFASAAGSSTASVVEYMLACFFQLEKSAQFSFADNTLGIIGVGRIGSLLQQAAHNIGLKTLCNDPPRQAQTTLEKFHSLEYLLQHADILTLHTPLVEAGDFPTRHLIGEKELLQFQGKGIINAARGTCLDNQALLAWLNKDKEHFAILDCWEHEPNINQDLLSHPQLMIATPHIAGHSLDGKAANTLFIYRHLCDFLKVKPTWDITQQLPAITKNTLPDNLNLQNLALQMYPIAEDSKTMKENAHAAGFEAWFSHYRRHYPIRRSWSKILAVNPNYEKVLFF